MTTFDHVRREIGRVLVQDEGQDLIEYALLTGIIAIAGVVVFPIIRTKMAAAYAEWNTGAQGIAEPPPPL